MLSIYETCCDLMIDKRMFPSCGSATPGEMQTANGSSLDGAVIAKSSYEVAACGGMLISSFLLHILVDMTLEMCMPLNVCFKCVN